MLEEGRDLLNDQNSAFLTWCLRKRKWKCVIPGRAGKVKVELGTFFYTRKQRNAWKRWLYATSMQEPAGKHQKHYSYRWTLRNQTSLKSKTPALWKPLFRRKWKGRSQTEEIFARYISDKKKKKTFIQHLWETLKTYPTKTILLQNEQRFWRDASSKKIYRWQAGIWNNAHWSTGKCKLYCT